MNESINPELLHAIDLTILSRIELLLHPLEVSLLRLLTNFLLIYVTDRLVKLLTEQVIPLDVRLYHIQLVQALILGEDGVLACCCTSSFATAGLALVPDEISLLLLVSLQGNLLPQTLDGHEDDAMLTSLL